MVLSCVGACGKNGANMPTDRLKYSFTAHNLAQPTVALADFFHCVPVTIHYVFVCMLFTLKTVLKQHHS